MPGRETFWQVALNKALQNYVIGMISDSSVLAAKNSLMVMIQAHVEPHVRLGRAAQSLCPLCVHRAL